MLFVDEVSFDEIFFFPSTVCFKIFDPDGAGYLDEAGFRVMVTEFLRAQRINVLPQEARSVS